MPLSLTQQKSDVIYTVRSVLSKTYQPPEEAPAAEPEAAGAE